MKKIITVFACSLFTLIVNKAVSKGLTYLFNVQHSGIAVEDGVSSAQSAVLKTA